MSEAGKALRNRIHDVDNENDTLRWHLLHAEAERDDALWTLERVNGRARLAPHPTWMQMMKAIRDIRAMAERGLKR